jgi:hypothetical protein
MFTTAINIGDSQSSLCAGQRSISKLSDSSAEILTDVSRSQKPFYCGVDEADCG